MTEKTNAILDNNNRASTAGWIWVYNIDITTREYIVKTYEYLMLGVGLPAGSYNDEPPLPQAGYAVCRSKAGNTWEQVEDHRGETAYDIATLQSTIIVDLGAIDTPLTPLVPATAYDVWNGSAWVTDTVAQKAAQENAAIAEQASLISAANAKSQLWQIQLMLGIITDGDKSALISWMKYVQAVQAIDTTAVEIIWPPIPG